MIILGLDPGLGTTGWGLIRAEGNRLTHIANGQLKTASAEALPARLAHLASQLEALIADRPADATRRRGHPCASRTGTGRAGPCDGPKTAAGGEHRRPRCGRRAGGGDHPRASSGERASAALNFPLALTLSLSKGVGRWPRALALRQAQGERRGVIG